MGGVEAGPFARGQTRNGADRPKSVPADQPKVWVKGHVPREFLDWVERYWSHDGETRAMLGGWGFGVWEG